jgi:hypothetical protein
MRRILLSSSLLLALSSPTMAAPIFKWVDAQGITHFSAQPPENRPAVSINPTIAPPSTHAAVALPPPDTGADEQKAINDKVKREVAEQEAKRKEYCKTVRTNLAQMESNPRVRMELDGEVRRLTEEERQAKILEAKQGIQKNCD